MDYKDVIKDKRLAKTEQDKQEAFINSIKDVSNDIRDLLSSLETSGAKKLDKQVISAISALGSIVNSLQSIKLDSDDEVKEILRAIGSIIQNIEVKPVVNVQPAKITIQERELDLKPITDALKKDPLPITLSDYKAQDINNSDPHTQYVGFVNQNGEWYIIENSENDNSLRYIFGEKNYTSNFKKASTLNYRLYNEAINAKV